MDTKNFIEPGSLDLDDVHISLGGVLINDLTTLQKWYYEGEKGNKFVVAEHFVGPDGIPVKEEQFNIRTMCYSLFIAPVTFYGSHDKIMDHFGNGRKSGIGSAKIMSGVTGKIVGGGILQISPKNELSLEDRSGHYSREPLQVREKFLALLGEYLISSGFGSLEVQNERFVPPSMVCPNPYWIRFRQVLDAENNISNQEIRASRMQTFWEEQ